MKNKYAKSFLEENVVFDDIENDIYNAKFVDTLLENDEMSFEEAAFMSGYADFS